LCIYTKKILSLKKAIYLYVSILFTFYGCISGNTINEHFEVHSLDGSGNNELIYIDDDEHLFTVIEGKVFAYQKCGNKLFIKQHPLNNQREANLSVTKYFIVDLEKSYIEESSKPYDHSLELFNAELRESCNGTFVEP
jgi:hypothetical protein